MAKAPSPRLNRPEVHYRMLNVVRKEARTLSPQRSIAESVVRSLESEALEDQAVPAADDGGS